MKADCKLVGCLLLCACLLQTACGVSLRSAKTSLQMGVDAQSKADVQPTQPSLSGGWVDGSNNWITIAEASDGTLTISSTAHGRISGSRSGNRITVGFSSGTQISAEIVNAEIVNAGSTLRLDWSNGSSWTRLVPRASLSAPSLSGDWVDDSNNRITIAEASDGTLTVNTPWRQPNGRISGTRIGDQISVGFNSGTQLLTAVIANNGLHVIWSNGSVWRRTSAIPTTTTFTTTTTTTTKTTTTTQPSLSGLWIDEVNSNVILIEFTEASDGGLTVKSPTHGLISGTRRGNQITVGFNAGTQPLTAVIAHNGNALEWSNGSTWKRFVANPRRTQPSLAGLWVDGVGTYKIEFQEADRKLTVNSPVHGLMTGARIGDTIIVGFGKHLVEAVIRDNGNALEWHNGTAWKRV